MSLLPAQHSLCILTDHTPCPTHRYYGTVQSLPKVSQTDMCQYLRETAQVCADSVEQYAPDITSEKTGPTSMVTSLTL